MKEPNFPHEVAVLNARALSNPEDRRGYRHTARLAAAVSLQLTQEIKEARAKLVELSEVRTPTDLSTLIHEIDAILVRAELVCSAMVRP
jgi:hypothetical protein